MVSSERKKLIDQLNAEGRIEVPVELVMELMREAEVSQGYCRWSVECAGGKATITTAV